MSTIPAIILKIDSEGMIDEDAIFFFKVILIIFITTMVIETFIEILYFYTRTFRGHRDIYSLVESNETE
jgi:hypothetical protein